MDPCTNSLANVLRKQRQRNDEVQEPIQFFLFTSLGPADWRIYAPVE